MNVGDRVTVEKYGSLYTAKVVRVYRSRFDGEFTGANGRTYVRKFAIVPVTRNVVERRYPHRSLGAVTYHPAA